MAIKLKVEMKKSIRIVSHITWGSGNKSKSSSRAYTSSHHAAVAYFESYIPTMKNRPKTYDELEYLKLKVYNRVRPIFKKMLDEK